MTATRPRADLRTLAARALADAEHSVAFVGDYPLAQAKYLAVIDAVLADLLPEHRRMVLREAAADLHRVATHLRDMNPDSSVAKGVRYAEARMRAQLAAAPLAGASAPVPAENAPAVPEEAWDSIRAFAQSVRWGSWSERQAAEFVIAVDALAVSGGAT